MILFKPTPAILTGIPEKQAKVAPLLAAYLAVLTDV